MAPRTSRCRDLTALPSRLGTFAQKPEHLHEVFLHRVRAIPTAASESIGVSRYATSPRFGMMLMAAKGSRKISASVFAG